MIRFQLDALLSEGTKLKVPPIEKEYWQGLETEPLKLLLASGWNVLLGSTPELALTARPLGVTASLYCGEETVWCFEWFPVPFHVFNGGRRRQRIRCLQKREDHSPGMLARPLQIHLTKDSAGHTSKTKVVCIKDLWALKKWLGRRSVAWLVSLKGCCSLLSMKGLWGAAVQMPWF